MQILTRDISSSFRITKTLSKLIFSRTERKNPRIFSLLITTILKNRKGGFAKTKTKKNLCLKALTLVHRKGSLRVKSCWRLGVTRKIG